MERSGRQSGHEVLRDSYGRTLDYLRISLTEDCNFRCEYCVPSEVPRLASMGELLTTDELLRLARIFVNLGVRRVRLTGGEPLLRKDIVSLVRSFASTENLSDVALTTNGSRLADLARPMKEAGLTTVNVSLDSLDRERFERITRRNRLDDVLRGVRAALDAALRVKVNVMALSDLSREEVLAFCRLAVELPISVRFLEFMPLCGEGWTPERMLPIAKVKEWVATEHELVPLPRGNHTAETFALERAPGTIGFIASLSEPFCDRCNRLRLTASGELSLCLFSAARVDLKSLVRNGAPDGEISERIRAAALTKPEGREHLNQPAADLPRIRLLGG